MSGGEGTWTARAVSLLLDMYTRGSSRKAMAAALGVTEPAVHAQLDRLAAAGKVTLRARQAAAPIPPPGAAATDLPPGEPPTDGTRTVADVAAGECRYPFGDPHADSFRFCGRPVVAGGPYCLAHAARCYGKPAASHG